MIWEGKGKNRKEKERKGKKRGLYPLLTERTREAVREENTRRKEEGL